MRRRPPARVLVAVGLIAGSTLALQVLLTRILAAELFYHFGFLAISLALLGVGAGALAVYAWHDRFDRIPLERALAWAALAYAVLLPLLVIVAVRLDYTYYGVTLHFAWNLGLACLLAALPFTAAGVAIALAVRGYTATIGRLYAFDLVGAGIGAVVMVPLMWVVAVPTLAVALAFVAALAALLFAGGAALERKLALAACAAAALVVALSATTSLTAIRNPGPKPVAERWTPIARVIGYGLLPHSDASAVVYDRVIAEVIPYRRGTPIPDWRRVKEGPQSIGYALTGPGRSLVIGGGGGRDILNALSQRQRVDVIELNRGIRDVVDTDLRSVSGSPYTLPGVSTAIGDGRSTLAERGTRYDTVHLGFTDTFSANSGQAFALTESNLYTLEAFRQYLDHLRPGGVLNVSRPNLPTGSEAVRATVVALAALRDRGIAHPERNVVAITGTYKTPFNSFPYGTVLARLRPYTPRQIALVERLAAQRGGRVAYAPGLPGAGDWAGLARARSFETWCAHAPYDYCPPTDDKPFFFAVHRLSNIGSSQVPGGVHTPDPLLLLLFTLAVELVLAALAYLLPLVTIRRAGRPTAGSLVFFGAIGLGFLMVEVVLIQRFVLFLGFPTYALSVVLFALLISTGVGAFVSTRFEREPRRALTVALAGAVAAIAAASYGLQPLLRALIGLPFAARVAVTVALLAPVGVVLGMAMPLGLRRLAALHPVGVPWAWGINGVASVVASVLAVALAILYGYPVATLVAAACYAVALGHVLVGRWPTGSAPPATTKLQPAREPATR